jgi:hypothetical protein
MYVSPRVRSDGHLFVVPALVESGLGARHVSSKGASSNGSSGRQRLEISNEQTVGLIGRLVHANTRTRLYTGMFAR